MTNMSITTEPVLPTLQRGCANFCRPVRFDHIPLHYLPSLETIADWLLSRVF